MYNVILVGLGGFVGSVGRYLAYQIASSFNHPFPMATLLVNSVGCFAIGAFSAVSLSANPKLVLLVSVGMIGGFTTFSAFGSETVELLRSNPALAILNIFGNLLLGIGAVIGGRMMVTLII